MSGLNHPHIVNLLGYGSDGRVVKPSGREITNLVFLALEYIPGGIFYDTVEKAGAMGENAGRFFMRQMMDVLTYLNGKGVCHRDLKLENILIDKDLNLKVADFGFATFRKVNRLQSYRGTKTYMAPEIKEGKVYDGFKADMFSLGVILFIIVKGIFPFAEARKDEYFYNLLISGDHEKYWKKTGGQKLSDDFKDLLIKMVHYDPAKRPSIEEFKNHPWMQTKFDVEQTRSEILEKVEDKSTQASE